MSKAISNAEQKRGDIIEAATRLFLEQGYAATGMDGIAQTAGVTKQTVYRYFPSKEELFADVMAEVRNEATPPYVFSSGSPAAELTGFGNYLLALHLQPKALGLYRLMVSEGREPVLSSTFMRAGPQQTLQPLLGFLAQAGHDGDSGLFLAQMFAAMILTPRNAVLVGGVPVPAPEAQARHVAKVVHLFLKTLTQTDSVQ